MITGSSHTGFQVRDLDRSLAFYRDRLGFEVRMVREVDDEYLGRLVGYPGVRLRQAFLGVPGSKHWFELIEYQDVERTPVDPGTANPGTAHLSLLVSDLRTLHRELVEAGVEFAGELVEVPAGPNVGALAAYMTDPDGIRVELVQPA